MASKFHTCKGIQKYLLEKTNKVANVTKTENNLHVSFVKDGELRTWKCPCHVIYCLEESALEPLIEQMGGTIAKQVRQVDEVYGGSLDWDIVPESGPGATPLDLAHQCAILLNFINEKGLTEEYEAFLEKKRMQSK